MLSSGCTPAELWQAISSTPDILASFPKTWQSDDSAEVGKFLQIFQSRIWPKIIDHHDVFTAQQPGSSIARAWLNIGLSQTTTTTQASSDQDVTLEGNDALAVTSDAQPNGNQHLNGDESQEVLLSGCLPGARIFTDAKRVLSTLFGDDIEEGGFSESAISVLSLISARRGSGLSWERLLQGLQATLDTAELTTIINRLCDLGIVLNESTETEKTGQYVHRAFRNSTTTNQKSLISKPSNARRGTRIGKAREANDGQAFEVNGIHSVVQSANVADNTGESPQPDAGVVTPRKRKRQGQYQGRPRKFAKGTEAFWRGQFVIAKQQAHPNARKVNTTNITDNPASVQLYNQRPATFDETLVTAVQHGLPVPETPQEITQDWIDRTSTVLQRSDPGLYITPKGVQPNNWLVNKPDSQVLILRSPRLQRLDLSNVQTIADVRFITSSAAHTFHYRRFYPLGRTPWPNYLAAAPIVLDYVNKSRSQGKDAFELPAVIQDPQLNHPQEYFPSSPAATRTALLRKRAAEESSLPKPKRQKVQRWLGGDISSTQRDTLAKPTIPTVSVLPPLDGEITPRPRRTAARKARELHKQILADGDGDGLRGSIRPEPDDDQSSVDAYAQPADEDVDEDRLSDDRVEGDAPDQNLDTRGHNPEPGVKKRRRRRRNIGRGGMLGEIRKSIILQMLDKCGGAMPNNPSCPWRMFQQLWKQANSTEPADIAQMKKTCKLLCDSGRMMQMKFGMRGKRRSLLTRSIYLRPDVHPTDRVVVELQRMIMDADPEDYVPPELANGFQLDLSEVYEQAKEDIPNGQPPQPPVIKADRQGTKVNGVSVAWTDSYEARNSLPTCLDDILLEMDVPKTSLSNTIKSEAEEFDLIVDILSQWELRTYNLLRTDITHKNFIDLTTAHHSPLTTTNSDEDWVHKFSGPIGPTEPLLEEEEDSIARPFIPHKKDQWRVPASKTPLADKFLEKQDEDNTIKKPKRKPPTYRPMQLAPPPPKRKRALVIDRRMTGRATADGSHLPLKRTRGIQYLRAMTDDEVYRIAVTVVVIRTLSGGLEKYIDWPMIMAVLPPTDEQFARDRWRTLANRYRMDVRGLTESFQERYSVALERNEVPSVNFDDLSVMHPESSPDGTDWLGIVDWAMRNIDRFNVKRVGELPDDRMTFVQEKELTFEEFKGMRELLGYNVNATVPRKEEGMNGILFSTPLESTPAQPPPTTTDNTTIFLVPSEIEEATDPELTLARSWVFATVLTTSANWDVKIIRAKLLTLAPTEPQVESLINRSLISLQRDKAIIHNRDGRSKYSTVLDGGWQVSLKFFEHFEGKRMVNASMLRAAVRYKRDVLDAIFFPPSDLEVSFEPQSQTLTIPKDAVVDDGHMMAILNLVSTGHLRLGLGDDVPKARYGLDWQTNQYQTRLMDKSVLSFTVTVLPGQKPYQAGDPFEEIRASSPVPRCDMDEFTPLFPVSTSADVLPAESTPAPSSPPLLRGGKIPVWFDILGNFNRDMWETCVAAVAGIVSMRSGVDEVEIRRTLACEIGGWEVRLLLEWMERVGVVRKIEDVGGNRAGKGWTTGEYWWCVLWDGDVVLS